MSRSILVFTVIAALGLAACGDRHPDALVPSTRDASSVVNETLLGENYKGAGDYTLLASRQAYSSSCGCVVVAARVDIVGVGERTLFWSAGGRNLGDGLIVGDAAARQFSEWGDVAGVGSPMAQSVEDAKATPEGQAVLLEVEGP